MTKEELNHWLVDNPSVDCRDGGLMVKPNQKSLKPPHVL